MRTAVHKYGPEAMRATGLEDVQPLKVANLEKLRPISGGNLPRAAGRFAACVRFSSMLYAVGEQRSCPRLKGNLAELRFGGEEWVGRFSGIGGEEPKVLSDVGSR